MSKLENSTFEHVVGIHFSVDFFHFLKRRISYSFFFLGDVLFVSEGVFFFGWEFDFSLAVVESYFAQRKNW